MPITPFLNGERFDLETKRVMGVAFEMARAALRLEDRGDPIVAKVADKIIALAKGGELNPDLLCERALADLAKEQPPRWQASGDPPADQSTAQVVQQQQQIQPEKKEE
jgi:hypothetical protein